ncbi:PREDICTED: uncharacterized protein LOC109116557 [Tarenaya hassleriana]|uniref:uncharacterized protein LOC109116557 n=1 Tax=Tarenaya hassleriana TaxID=28532 RepID=UPI0008FD04FF|nr:PREDICTED: uncharacterized protein LOC109116557 [Tarenaya hassleriana]
MRIIDAVRGLLKEVGLLGKEGFVPSPTVQENPMIDPVDKDISTPRSTATPRSTVQEIRKSPIAKERVTTSPLMCSVGTDEYYDQDVGLFELRTRDVTPLESEKETTTAQEALVTEKEPSPKEKEASSKEKEPSPKEVDLSSMDAEVGRNVPEEDAEENDSDDDAGSGDENTEEEGDTDGDEGETTDEDSEKDDADGDDTNGEEGEGTDDDDTTAESSDKESAAKTNEDTDMSAPPVEHEVNQPPPTVDSSDTEQLKRTKRKLTDEPSKRSPYVEPTSTGPPTKRQRSQARKEKGEIVYLFARVMDGFAVMDKDRHFLVDRVRLQGQFTCMDSPRSPKPPRCPSPLL